MRYQGRYLKNVEFSIFGAKIYYTKIQKLKSKIKYKSKIEHKYLFVLHSKWYQQGDTAYSFLVCHFPIQKQSKELAIEIMMILDPKTFHRPSTPHPRVMLFLILGKSHIMPNLINARAFHSTGVRSSGVRISRGHGAIYE